MKRKLKSIYILLISFGISALFLSHYAYADHYSGYYTYTISDDGATITQVDTFISGNVVIPECLGGVSVAQISGNAFNGCNNVIGITVPESVKIIHDGAFDYCDNLMKIIVDQNNENFSSDANGVLYNKNKTLLIRHPIASTNTEYSMPDSVVSVNPGAFRFCKNLNDIILGKEITVIGERAFDSAYNLKKIVIPEGVTEIGSYAFNGCMNLTEVRIPESVTFISDTAFGKTEGITDIIVDESNKFYSSSDGVLYNKNKSVLMKYAPARQKAYFNLPETVTSIGCAAFSDSKNLTEVYLNNKLKVIGNSAFSGCEKLNEIIIPGSVSELGENVFSGCTSLARITIPDGVTVIKEASFADCAPLSDIGFPDSIETIEDRAFIECDSLEKISLPKSIEYIGSYAFNGCDKLTDMIIYNRIISIGRNAFADCNNLETVHYTGSKINWNNIDFEEGNDLIGKTLHFILINQRENPTCTENGYEYGLYCSDCGVWIQGHKVIPSAGHRWDKGVTVKKSTCKTKGSIIYTCENDSSHTYTKALPLDNKNHEGKAVSCSEVPASCTEIGYTSGTYCYGCEKWISGHEIIPKTKHKYSSTLTKEATCTQDGIISFYCICKDSYISVIPARGHKFSSKYTIDKAATCNATGSKSRHCTVDGCDGKTDITLIKKLPHNEVALPERKATCTASGLTAGKKCKSCNAVLKEQKKIPKLKHTEVILPGVNATCTDTGVTEGRKCKTCGKIILAQKKIKKNPHIYVTVTQKATLSKNGSVFTRCMTCKSINTNEKIYYPASIKLSSTSYVYDNSVKTPSVIIKDKKNNSLKKDRDYDVSYEKGRKSPGRYTVKITFKGKYEGEKKLYFVIRPKVTSKISASQTSTTITLKWSKVTGTYGYRVYRYNKTSKTYEKLKDVKSTEYKDKSLKTNTVYKYKIRAFTKDYGTILGNNSPAFTTATGPAKPSIKVSSVKKGTATVSWKRVKGADGYQLYYSTNKTDGYKRVNSYNSGVSKATKLKLTSGKVYYFKLRASRKLSNTRAYSSWSDVKKIKVK